MDPASTPVEVFCSYAHEDEVWLRKLETHLSLLQQQEIISLWHDRLITPGTDWAHTIDAHLETASVILLLVSADFFTSGYCYGVEMKRALERQQANEVRVIPLLIRPGDWTTAPFAHLQALPTDGKTLTLWKNKDTALANITAGIRRVVVEELPHLSVSAPRAALPTIWNIPYPRNPFFQGRDELLVRLYSQLQEGRVIALHGLGGIGKTQLALEYAYRHHKEYKAVLWVRADSQDTLISSFVDLADLLKLSVRNEPDQKIIVEAVLDWLCKNSNWLLIFDDVDSQLICRYLSQLQICHGHILPTTCSRGLNQLVLSIEVNQLDDEQGPLFLLRRLGYLAPKVQLQDARADVISYAQELNREMEGLPLALDQAAAYIAGSGCGLDDYLLHYRTRPKDLLEQCGDCLWNFSKERNQNTLAHLESVDIVGYGVDDNLCSAAQDVQLHLPSLFGSMAPLPEFVSTDINDEMVFLKTSHGLAASNLRCVPELHLAYLYMREVRDAPYLHTDFTEQALMDYRSLADIEMTSQQLVNELRSVAGAIEDRRAHLAGAIRDSIDTYCIALAKHNLPLNERIDVNNELHPLFILVDSLRAALKSEREAPDIEQVKVKLVDVESILHVQGWNRFTPAIGTRFDRRIHEIQNIVNIPQVQLPDRVTAVLHAGYKRVKNEQQQVRLALVNVSN